MVMESPATESYTATAVRPTLPVGCPPLEGPQQQREAASYNNMGRLYLHDGLNTGIRHTLKTMDIFTTVTYEIK